MKIKMKIINWIIIGVSAIIFASVIYSHNKVFIISFEQLLYGAMKIEGSGVATALYGFIYISIATLLIFPILLLPVIDFGKKITIKIKNKLIQVYPILKVTRYSCILLILSIILLLNVFQFFPFIKNTVFDNTKLFDDYYVDSSKVDITFPEGKNNLIYIFVESLENSNLSKENGGLFEETITPNLENMALQNINFSSNDKIGGAYQANGTNWTASAMIAQTSGIPLKVTFNDFDVNSTKFMNIATTGDILYKNGYNSYLLLGSDAGFGGRKAYFSNHNYLISDYYTAIEEGKIASDYYEWWGYEDAKLFEYAKEMLLDISKNDKNFNFTMLTADTHFTDGYMDESCENKFEEKYANALYCSDNKINNFIEWIKEQDFYENTTIVIVGDHLTMQDGFYEYEEDYNRTVYNVFINSKIDGEYNNKNRVFTTMDMFPTTLAAIGADIEGDRLGLGTNLFSDKQTIPEIIGMNKFNEEIMKGSNYYYNYIRK